MMVVVGGYSTILASEKGNNCTDQSSVTVFHKGEGTYDISYNTAILEIDILDYTKETGQFGTGTNVTQCLGYYFDPFWVNVRGYSVPDKKEFEIGRSESKFPHPPRPTRLCYEVSGPKEKIKIAEVSCPKVGP